MSTRPDRITIPLEDFKTLIARAYAALDYDEAWPTNEELFGGPTETRDDELKWRANDYADEIINAYLVEVNR